MDHRRLSIGVWPAAPGHARQPPRLAVSARLARRLTLGLLLLAATLALATALTASGAVLFVDNSVANNPPTSWSRIQWAVDNASGGDTVYVYSGTYVEAVSITTTINLVGEDADTTNIRTPIFSLQAAVYVNANNVNISSFTLKNSNYGVDLFKYTTDLTIDDVRFDANTRGINAALVDDLTVGNSYFVNHTGSSQYAVYASRDLGLVIHNSTFVDNYYHVLLSQTIQASVRDSTFTGGRYGIYTTTARGSSLERNEIHNMSTSNYGIRLQNEVDGVLIDNSVHDTPLYGLYVSNAISLTMSGNDIYSNVYNIYLAPINDATGLYHGHSISGSNLVEGRPVRYVVNASNVSIPAGAGWVAAYNVTNLDIGFQEISNTYAGIWLNYVDGVQIAGLNFSSSNYYTSYALMGYNVDNLQISGLNTTGRGYGTYFYYSSNLTIDDSHIVGPSGQSRVSTIAWRFSFSNSIVVTNSHVDHAAGAQVFSSSGARFEANTFNDSGRPFYSSSSPYGVLRSNVLTNSSGPFLIYGSDATHFYWDIPTNNTMDGRPFRSYVNASGNLPASSLAWVLVASATNASLSNYVANIGTDSGGVVAFSSYVTFSSATFHESSSGFFIFYSDHVTVLNSVSNGSSQVFQISQSSQIVIEGGSWTNVSYEGLFIEYVYDLRIANITFTGAPADFFVEGYEAGNITVEDVTSRQAYYFFYIESAFGLTLNRVDASNQGPVPVSLVYAVYLWDVTTVNITDSSIADYDTFLWIGSTCSGFFVSGNTVTNVTSYGVYSTYSTTSGVTVNGTLFEGVPGGSAIAAVYVEQMGYPLYVTNLDISGFDEGIHVEDPSSFFFVTVWIEGNQINNTTVGIHVVGLWWSAVMWNTVQDTVDQGILVQGSTAPVNVHNNTVINPGSVGIELGTDTGLSVHDNHIEGGNIGIWLRDGNGHHVLNNSVNGASDTGIYVANSHVSSQLIANNITNGYTGLYINRVSYLTLDGNSMSGNAFNFRIEAFSRAEYYHSVSTSNLVDGKPIEYHVNATGLFLGSGTGLAVLVNTTGSVLTGATMANNYAGVTLHESSGISIIGTTVSSSYYGVRARTVYDWTISGFTADGCNYGVFAFIGSNLTLTGSTMNGSIFYGAYISSTSHSQISNNSINGTGSRGIYLVSANSNLIENNQISNSSYLAMDSWYSSWNTYNSNALTLNRGSLSIGGNQLRHYIQTFSVNTTIDGRPIFYRSNATNVTVPPGVGMVILANVSGATVADQQIDSPGEGIIVYGSEFVTIDNITFGSGIYGMNIGVSKDVLISGLQTNVSDCCLSTVLFVEGDNERVTLENSRIERASTIVQAYYTSNITIRNLTLGAWPTYSTSYLLFANGRVDNITVEGVDFNYTWTPIYLYGYSGSDQVTNVTVRDSNFGPYTSTPLLVASSYAADITFYHNNFDMTYAGSGYNVPSDPYGVSVWDAGYPDGGNHWSNWTSPDLYTDVGQNVSGPDGLVDMPLSVTDSAADAYPLVDPWPPRISLLSPANGSAIWPGTLLDFHVPRYFDTAWYAVDNGSAVAFFSPFDINTSGWSQGDYYVEVNASDATGVEDRQYFLFSIDTSPPVIDWVSPAPSGTYPAGILLNFTITDLHLAPNATWDAGWGQQPFDTPWNVSTTGWADGLYTVTVRAWDTPGWGVTANFAYWIDADPPSITLNSPANGSVFGPGATIDLSILDTSFQNASWSIGLGWNSLSAPFNISTTGWSEGAATLVVQAQDTFGRSSVDSFEYTVDDTDPVIVLNAPSNNSFIPPGTTIDLGISDTHLVNASWSTGGPWYGLSSPFDISTAGWSDGAETLTVVAFDEAGNSRVEILGFTIDSIRPTIVLDSPSNNSVVAAGTTLAFTITDANPFTATWNNGGCCSNSLTAPYDVDTTGWSDASYTVLIVATDGAGNSRSTTFEFTIDSTLPSVSLSSPSNGSVIKGGTVLDLAVLDLHLSSVTYDNGTGAVALASPFDIATPGWPDGSTDVWVNATDSAGNVRSVSYHFTFDSTPPSVSLVTPANGSSIMSGVDLDFSISDTNFASASWNNGGCCNTSLTTPFDIDTSAWAEGAYAVVVDAVDQAGNQRTVIVLIDIDDSAPTVTLNQPTNGSTFGAGTLIDFGITDVHGFTATWDNGTGANALASPFDVDTTGWADGTFTVWVNATDAAGNAVSDFFVFDIDNTFPAVILQAPSNNSVIVPGTTLNLDVVDNDLNSVTWDNGSGTSTLNSPYDISTTGWSDGHVNVTIVATDNSSHTVEVVFHFIIDSVDPVLTLNSPTNSSVIRAGTQLNVSVLDLNMGTVTWDNGSGTNLLPPPYNVDTAGWADGGISVVFTVTDLAGNSVADVFEYTMDTTAPSISLGSPSNNSVILPGTTLVMGISDTHTFNATWDNGSGANAFSIAYNISTTGWPDATVDVLVVAVDIAGNIGSRVYRFTFDSITPSVTLNSPSNGSVIQAGTTLDFTVTDAHLVSATWDTGSGTSSLPSPYDISTSGWSDGVTTVWVNATDAAGNVAVDTFEFTLDSTAPVITLASPANDSTVQPGTTVDIQLSDASALSVTWNNGSGAVALASPYDIATGGWPEGPTNISVVAVDAAGNSATKVFHLRFDATPPSVSLVSPSNGSVIPAGTTLDLSVTDLNGLSGVTWDNGGGPTALASPFDISTAGWSDGSYTVDVTATDVAGNTAVRFYDFELDSLGPSISLAAPSNGSVIAPGTIVDLVVSDTNGVSNVTWDNGSGAVTTASPYDINTTTWPDGGTSVTVTAYDTVGNVRVEVFEFTLDGTAPTVTLDAPTNGSVILPGTTLGLSISDPHLANATWDNGSGPQTLTSPYDVSTNGWSDGVLMLRVNATDSAGNVRLASFVFTLDGTSPLVSLVSPANGSYIAAGTVIDLDVTDANLNSATWDNGTGASALAAPFNVSTAGWLDGSVTLTVNATDLAGNAVVATFSFTMDSTYPTVVLIAPSNNSFARAGDTLDFDASDLNLDSVTWDNGSGANSLDTPFDVPTDGWPDGSTNVTVVVTDLAGNSVWATYEFTFDSTLPLVVLNAPTNGSIITAGTVINLSVTDLYLDQVIWNNGSGNNAFGAPFDIGTGGWPDGVYTVVVTATDLAGNTRVAVLQFTFDTSPPVVSLLSPTNNSYIQPGQVLNLQVTDLTALTVTYDIGGGPIGIPSPFDVNTSGWGDGHVNVTVIATDAVGNSASRILHFIVDGTLPAITLITPGNNSVVFRGTPIDFLITDTNLDTATWDNGGGPSAFVTQWNISTTGWSDNSYDILVEVEDLAGNIRTRLVRISIDTLAPSLSLNTPVNNSHITPGTVINLTVTDPNLFQVTWDDGTGAQGFTTPWNISTAGWGDGTYDLTVVAQDAAGNTRSRTFHFTVDSTLPALSLNTPGNNSYIVAGTVLNFTITDLNLDTATWDRGTGAQGFSPMWNISTTGWADGDYNVSVSASDLAGNTRVRVYHFILDSTLPSVVLDTPANNAVIRAGTSLNFTVADATLSTVVWNNGGGNQTFSPPWRIPTSGWPDGSVTVTVYAVDLAGNLRAAAFQFTMDSTFPSIGLAPPPANNSYVPAGTALGFNIVEANLASASWDRGLGSQTFVVQWTILTGGWADGLTNVTVTATDLAGNVAQALFRFTFDSTPPVILDPTWNGSYVDRGAVLNISAAETNLEWFAWTNGQGASGNVSTPTTSISTAAWADGVFSVVIEAADLAGHRVSRTAQVTVDSVVPVISGVSPTNGSFVTPGTPIQFTVTETNPGTVTWQRDAGPVQPLVGAGPYTVDTMGWGDGSWNVHLVATDLAGHQARVTLQLVTDQTPPQLPILLDLNVDEDVLQTLDASAANDGPNPLNNGSFEWNLSGRLNALLPGPVVQYTWVDPGDYTVQLTITDLAGNIASTTFDVFVQDTTPPTAEAGADQTVDEGTAVSIDATASFDNDAIQSYSWRQLAGPAVGIDPAAATTGFTPTVPGTYVFEIVVTDASGLTGSDNITVGVLDITPPTIALPPFPVVNEGQVVTFDASSTTDNDPTAAGNMTFGWTFAYNGPKSLTGVVANWTFDAPGSYDITLTAIDPSGNAATSTLTLRVNDVPSLSSLPADTITLPSTYQGVIAVLDSDAGDTHNVTVTSPSGMVVIQLGANLALQWQPETIGFYVVNFTLSDGWSSASFSFNLTVGRSTAGNQPPEFTKPPNTSATAGSQYSYLPEATDVDGDSLLFGLDLGPLGMTIAPSTGRLTWSHGYGPTDGYHLDDVSLWVWDGAAYTFQNFTIRFIASGNSPPTILDSAPEMVAVDVGDSVDVPYFVYLSDQNDPVENLSLVAVSGSPGIATATVIGTGPGLAIQVTGIAEGTAFISLTLADPSGAMAQKTLQVTVNPVGTGTGPDDTGLAGMLLPLVALAAVGGGGGVLFFVMRRKKGEKEPVVTQAIAPPAAEVSAAGPATVAAPSAAVTAVAAGGALAGVGGAEKADTYTIEGLFVIYKDGRLLYSKTDMGHQKFEDPELVSSMFTAVQSFIKDSFAAEGELNKMGYGDNQIIIERGRHIFIAAIVYGEPDQEFTDKVRDVIEGIELSYAGIVEEWDGMMDAFSDMETKVAPIAALTLGVSRREVQLATTKQEVRMLSELEFFQGFVRLKVGVKNNTAMVITKVTVDIEYNEDVLRLGRVEPAAYRTAGAKVLLGVLNPAEKSSVAYYFDPQICTESQIDGVCRYRDATGVLHTVSMKTRRAEVVCPLFFTKEHANTAMLKRLVEAELSEKDSKVFQIQKMPPYIKWKDVFDLVKSVVNAHDVQMVREFTKYNTFQGEAWFYGETKVKRYKIVIRVSVIEETDTIEFFAASPNMKAITGLLAEFNHTLNSMVIEKYSDLKIELLFDNDVKAEIDRKSLMSQMSSDELEGGETEQDDPGPSGPN